MKIKFTDRGLDESYRGKGGSGIVFEFEGLALKVLHSYYPSDEIISGNRGFMTGSEARSRLEHELRIHQYLYQNEISVPEPKGICQIKLPNGIVEALAMEYIKGIDYSRFLENVDGFTKTEQAKIRGKDYWEIEKAEDLGVEMRDHLIHQMENPLPMNFIYVPETDKVVLIDFGRSTFSQQQKQYSS